MRSSRSRSGGAVFVPALAAMLSCIPAPSRTSEPPRVARVMQACAAARPERTVAKAKDITENVVLVTIDGVRWQEIFLGVDPALAAEAGLPESGLGGGWAPEDLVPNLHRLFFDEGTVLGAPGAGAGIAATGPRFVSLPAYLEMVTGSPSTCWTNDCEPDVPWTLLGELAEAPDAPRVSVFASWERIEAVVPMHTANLTLDAGRDESEPNAAYPGSGRYRPDRWTMPRALEHLVRERPRLTWIALGDTDEWAHRNDYRGYLEALAAADAFIGEIAAHLAEMGEWGRRTTLLVTTDHGRDANFVDHGGRASAAIWLMARGGAIEPRGVVATSVKRRLSDLAPTILTLLGRALEPCVECGSPITELL